MKAGWSKIDITPKTRNVVMMGYGHPKNLALSQKTPLFARALVIDDFVFLYLDINYITNNLHEKICETLLEKFDFTSERILITASHTHSAPGGFGDRLYYEVPTPGFQPEVFESYANGACQAIEDAMKKMSNAKAYWGKSNFEDDSQVGINRSLNSYKRNPDSDQSADRFKAINKAMFGLKLQNATGMAFINWFGVHTTSIPNFETYIHFDNKGYACKYLEEFLGEGSLAIFAQGSSGDVSPNFVFDKKIGQTRGPYKDYDRNASFNGNLQFEKAKEILENMNEVDLDIKSLKSFFNFPNLKTKDGKYALSSASFGTAFAAGTAEGPGLPIPVIKTLNKAIGFLQKRKLNKLKQQDQGAEFEQLIESQSPKNIFITPNRKELVFFDLKKVINLLGGLDPIAKNFKRLIKDSRYVGKDLYEESLPLQMTDLGPAIILAVPFEFTTMAAKRLTSDLKDKYKKDVVLAGYCNSYAGYVCTPEEYEQQAYEAGHTVFGKGTLPVLREVYSYNLDHSAIKNYEAN